MAYTTYTLGNNPARYNAATFYSYDIHGNVDTLLQDYGNSTFTEVANVMSNNNNRWKRLVYRYDLISGKVNHVAYQPQYINSSGKMVRPPDAFYHRYSYDAENRITVVETSSDSMVWMRDGRYDYYKHGPLARTVIGERQVQGVDYAYTLQGWLKGVNSTTLSTARDMGQDGLATSNNKYVAKDAYSYALHYFNNDYTAVSNLNVFAGYSGNLPSGQYRPLYNGNISSMAVNIGKLNSANNGGDSALLYNYKYDQLNRIKEMDAYRGLDTLTNTWSKTTMSAALNQYKERISYDANGNILKYLRHGNLTATPVMDSLNYQYTYSAGKLQHNKLNWVKDNVTAATYSTDIDVQATGNYVYDDIGNLIKDVSEGIDTIKWNVYGKITEIIRNAPTTQKPVKKITYGYDAAGNRISKKVEKSTTTAVDYTWYVRDASGNVMSTYTYTSTNATDITANKLRQNEVYLYGSSRLGSLTLTRDVEVSRQTEEFVYGFANGIDSAYRVVWKTGLKQYELSNHLGNVLVTISDKKFPVAPNNVNILGYTADVVTAGDFYPFGMQMPGRRFSQASKNYRYGFNGKEEDDEVKGDGMQQDYGMRIYDTRLGGGLSVDPLTKNYPSWSPYPYAMNRPIDGIDLDGLEWQATTTNYINKESTLFQSETVYTVKLRIYNSTDKTDQQIQSKLNIMKYLAEKNFSYYNKTTNDEGTKNKPKIVTYEASMRLNVEFDLSNTKKAPNPNQEFILKLVNNIPSSSEITGGQAERIGGTQSNMITIALDDELELDLGFGQKEVVQNGPYKLGHTFTHELGHTLGLRHVGDRKFGRNADETDPLIMFVGERNEKENNVMMTNTNNEQNSVFNYFQFEKMRKTIEKETKKENIITSSKPLNLQSKNF